MFVLLPVHLFSRSPQGWGFFAYYSVSFQLFSSHLLLLMPNFILLVWECCEFTKNVMQI